MRQKYKELRFRKAAERILSENPEFPGKITLLHSDGSPELPLYSKPLSYFLVAALPKFEATFLISPDSVPERPQLHLLYFEHTDSDTTMKIMNEAYDHGVHVENPLVNYLAIGPRDSVKLELDDSVQRDYLSKICIDGSVVLMKGKQRSITFGNSKRKGLKFVS
ncbi:DEKNAAC101154 [Brettanomyces naardenensis]|uniref:DEKNAAC101154 n=1 Tax=Brettanomyces naardenensis TaxID=13370 RepID=A0A448YH75_BRENA|nr:DEKNAAC101154 [Brettanomyces naardenensis]